MPKILHILKEPQTPIALEMIRQEAKKPGQEIMVLLIQEAVKKIGEALPRLETMAAARGWGR